MLYAKRCLYEGHAERSYTQCPLDCVDQWAKVYSQGTADNVRYARHDRGLPLTLGSISKNKDTPYKAQKADDNHEFYNGADHV